MPPESETGPSNFFRNLLCYSPQIIAGWGRPPGKQKTFGCKIVPFPCLTFPCLQHFARGRNIGSGGGQTVQDRPWNFYSPSIITQFVSFIHFMHNMLLCTPEYSCWGENMRWAEGKSNLGLGASWSPNSTFLHLDFYLSTNKYKRHSRFVLLVGNRKILKKHV